MSSIQQETKTYISILRGINVGGHKSIKMDQLKKILSALGFINVQTYIQSGNIIFQFKQTNTNELDAIIQSSIKKEFNFDVPVMTFTAEEWIKIANENPFTKDATKDIHFLHVTYLSELPQVDDLEKLKSLDFQSDEFRILNKAVYLYCPNSYSSSKLTNNFFEKKLKVNATTRNWKTVMELSNKIK